MTVSSFISRNPINVFAFHIRFLQRYVQKENESMQLSKSNLTASALATRQKKMAEVCSLVKHFIGYANKRKGTVISRSMYPFGLTTAVGNSKHPTLQVL